MGSDITYASHSDQQNLLKSAFCHTLIYCDETLGGQLAILGKKLKQDIVLNIALSFFVAFSAMWVVRRAGLVFTPVALGVFLLSRRIADTISNILQLGTAQTAKRYLSMSECRSSQLLCIITGLSIFTLVAFVFILGIIGDLKFWGRLVFPDSDSPELLVFWLAMLCVALVPHYFAGSILMAYRRVLAASIVGLFNTSVWLIIGLWWWQERVTVETLIRFQAVAIILFSSSVILGVIVQLTTQLSGLAFHLLDYIQNYKRTLKEFISYGFPRTIARSLEVSFLVIGPWLIRDNSEEAGYLIISFTLLRIGRMVVQPATQVIGVVVARLVGRGDRASLEQALSLLSGTLLHIGCLSTAVIYPWTRLLLRTWLGDSILAQCVYQYAAVIMLAILPFTVFQGLKAVIEMIWKQPRNLYTVSCGIVFLVTWFYVAQTFLPASVVIPYGYVGAFWINGILSIVWIRKYLKPIRYFGLEKVLTASVLVWVLNWLLVQWLSFASIWLNVAGAIFAGGFSITVAIAFIYFYRPSSFVREAIQFLWPKLEQPHLGVG